MKTISCKQAVDYILKKEEGKLSLFQQLSLWRHLVVCSLCRIFTSQNDLINQALKKRQERVMPLSDDEKEKIIQRVLNNQSEK